MSRVFVFPFPSHFALRIPGLGRAGRPAGGPGRSGEKSGGGPPRPVPGAQAWTRGLGGGTGTRRGRAGPEYLATGCSKCSASRRRPPSRLSSTSPVGFVHRTCRPSGPTQQLTMVSSTSATRSAALREPAAAMPARPPVLRLPPPPAAGTRADGAEGAGRRPEARAAGGRGARACMQPGREARRPRRSNPGLPGGCPWKRTASPSASASVNSALPGISAPTGFPCLPGTYFRRKRGAPENVGMGSPGELGSLPPPEKLLDVS